MNQKVTGFPADRIGFWVANWQLDSGEVPEIVSGATYELPLCFRWVGGPVRTSDPHYLRPVQDSGDFEVGGQHRITGSGEWLLVDGVPPLLGEGERRSFWRRTPTVQVAGTIAFEIPAGWANGWDDWTGGKPRPWPLYRVEVERLRMNRATGTRRHRLAEPIGKSGRSPVGDIFVEAHILDIQVGPAVPARR